MVPGRRCARERSEKQEEGGRRTGSHQSELRGKLTTYMAIFPDVSGSCVVFRAEQEAGEICGGESNCSHLLSKVLIYGILGSHINISSASMQNSEMQKRQHN